MDYDRGAHAPRVLAIDSSRSRTFLPSLRFSASADQSEVRFGETPKPARSPQDESVRLAGETRALPRRGGERQ